MTFMLAVKVQVSDKRDRPLIIARAPYFLLMSSITASVEGGTVDCVLKRSFE